MEEWHEKEQPGEVISKLRAEAEEYKKKWERSQQEITAHMRQLELAMQDISDARIELKTVKDLYQRIIDRLLQRSNTNGN